jgi:hypothetical protein
MHSYIFGIMSYAITVIIMYVCIVTIILNFIGCYKYHLLLFLPQVTCAYYDQFLLNDTDNYLFIILL